MLLRKTLYTENASQELNNEHNSDPTPESVTEAPSSVTQPSAPIWLYMIQACRPVDRYNPFWK